MVDREINCDKGDTGGTDSRFAASSLWAYTADVNVQLDAGAAIEGLMRTCVCIVLEPMRDRVLNNGSFTEGDN